MDVNDDLLSTVDPAYLTKPCAKCLQPSFPEWHISPIEMQPEQWKYHKGSPWTSDSSFEMFNLNNFLDKSQHTKSSSHFEETPLQTGVRGSATNILDKSLIQYQGGKGAFGRSFMFSPKARLNLSPDLQNLLRMNLIASKEDNANVKKSKRSTPSFQMDGIRISAPSQSRELVPKWFSDLLPGYPATKSDGSKMILGGDDPYLSILVPASSLSGTNIGDLGYMYDNAWLEIGCTVTSMKILGGVDFV